MHFPYALYTHHTIYVHVHQWTVLYECVHLLQFVLFSELRGMDTSLHQILRDQMCFWQPLRSSASSVPFLASLHVIVALVFLCGNTEALLVCFLLAIFTYNIYTFTQELWVRPGYNIQACCTQAGPAQAAGRGDGMDRWQHSFHLLLLALPEASIAL